MRIPFTNIKVTPKEQIGAGLTAVAGWTLFSAVASTAPLWASLIAIPGTAALGVGAVKAAQFVGRKVMEQLEDYAEKYPQGKVATFVAYAPSFGPDERDDHEMDFDADERFTAAERKGLYTDFAATNAATYTQRTLLNLREKAVQYTLAPLNRAAIDAIPEGTTRSGRRFGVFN